VLQRQTAMTDVAAQFHWSARWPSWQHAKSTFPVARRSVNDEMVPICR